MNLNKFAKSIAEIEDGLEEVNIAQIKEIMKIIFTELAHMEPIEIFKILKKYE